MANGNLGIYRDDQGVWRTIDTRTYGPFTDEAEALAFRPYRPTIMNPARLDRTHAQREHALAQRSLDS
jgi:hypothetical protein